MKTKKIVLAMVCALPFLGCTTPQQTASTEIIRFKPLYSVNNETHSADALYQLGRYYQGQQRFEQALTAYQRAVAVDPRFTEAHNGLGVIHAGQGRYAEAILAFRSAIEHAPGAAHLYNNLGHALSLQGAYAEAIQALEQAAALDPANEQARQNLVLAQAGVEKTASLMLAAAKPAPVAPAPVVASPEQLAAPVVLASALPTTQPVQETAHQVARPVQTPSVMQHAEPVVAAAMQPVFHQADRPALAPTDAVLAQAASQAQILDQQITATPAATFKSRLETVQVSANVYELRERTSPPRMVTAQPAQPVDVKAARLEVSNGNGVTGMARRVGGILGENGFDTARLTNQKPFIVKVSQIQYQPGFIDEARRLQTTLPGKPAIVESSKLRQDIKLRLLLGRDMTSRLAQLESLRTVQLASNQTAMPGHLAK